MGIFCEFIFTFVHNKVINSQIYGCIVKMYQDCLHHNHLVECQNIKSSNRFKCKSGVSTKCCV